MKGLGCALVLIIFMAVIATAGIATIASRVANYGQAREQTRQVQIWADATVTIAEKQADTAVALAEIQADTAKKTNGTFVLFYLSRFLLWVITILAAIIVVLVWLKFWQQMEG